MDYIKIRLGDSFSKLESEIEKTIQSMFHPAGTIFAVAERTWKPPIDMYETPEEVIIQAEIAGVRKEDLEIELNSKAARIYGFRSEAPRQNSARYRLAEILYGSFERIIRFPAPIDPDAVSASYVNGMLRIRLAKVPLDKTIRIAIKEE